MQAVVEHRRTSDDRAVLVDDVGVAVENEFVLRADHVHVHDRAVRFAGPSFDKRAAIADREGRREAERQLGDWKRGE